MTKRVVIGLSGGVDSSVAALILKEKGYDVTAVFMINWHDKTGILKGDCPWDQDIIFAEIVAKRIGIPFQVIDLSEKYREKVVEYMFSEYQNGRTPNPDILCNRDIKFNEFFTVLEKFNADYIATGHYCRTTALEKNGKITHSLLAGNDPGKDQSYFLCQLNQYQLSKTLFPIGHLQKSEVREMARKACLASAEKKDSQGICFVGKVNLPEFLQQKLKAIEGPILEVPFESEIFNKKIDLNYKQICQAWKYSVNDGIIVGKHHGAHFFTIGQRKGLNVGGKPEPLFVLATDTENNIIYTGQGQDHPGLFRKGLFIHAKDIHWINPDLEMQAGEERNYKVRVRYRQPLQKAHLMREQEGMYITFSDLQRGIAPGQFAAWYEGEELLGSGIID